MNLQIENVSLPPEVEKTLDKRRKSGGAGMAMGQALTGTFSEAKKEEASCIQCSKAISSKASFCQHCGAAQGATCGRCRAKLPEEAKFCPDCGAKQASTCTKCDSPLSPGANFCSSCGHEVT